MTKIHKKSMQYNHYGLPCVSERLNKMADAPRRGERTRTRTLAAQEQDADTLERVQRLAQKLQAAEDRIATPAGAGDQPGSLTLTSSFFADAACVRRARCIRYPNV